MKINPMDILPAGTKITVGGNKRGIIISHKIKQAIPSGLIVVHTIKLTEKIKILAVNKFKWVPMNKPKIYEINYTGINYGTDTKK